MYVATVTGSILAAVQGQYGVASVSGDGESWVAAKVDPAGFDVSMSQSSAPWHLSVASLNGTIKKWPATYHYNATAGAGGKHP